MLYFLDFGAHHLPSMLHRLPQYDQDRKPVLNEIQPDLNPLEILFDVKKLTTVAYVGRVTSVNGLD